VSRGHLVLEHALDQLKSGSQFRRDPDEDLDDLCESIRRTGVLNPPAVTEGYVIITGNRRVAAMQRLGMRVTPIWVVPGVSDKLSYILAIRDEQTLQKALKPLEQAELYEELKALYAEDAERRDAATRFGAASREADPTDASGSSNIRHGGADSAPPWRSRNEGKARVQAARAVTGRDSRTMLEQINQLKQIAADDDEDPYVRQHAAEALLEINEDRKVNGRFQAVRTRQNVARLTRIAEHPDIPEQARTAAATELRTLHDIDSPAEALKESGLALARVTEIQKAATDPALIGWKDVDPLLREKHQIRKLVDLLRREHGWWDRYDPTDFGQYADTEQWALVETYITEASGFLDLARQARAGREEAGNADV
jgi:ParB-like chromosome segregation protein Spo0J